MVGMGIVLGKQVTQKEQEVYMDGILTTFRYNSVSHRAKYRCRCGWKTGPVLTKGVVVNSLRHHHRMCKNAQV